MSYLFNYRNVIFLFLYFFEHPAPGIKIYSSGYNTRHQGLKCKRKFKKFFKITPGASCSFLLVSFSSSQL